jgi:hypothetical protein
MVAPSHLCLLLLWKSNLSENTRKRTEPFYEYLFRNNLLFSCFGDILILPCINCTKGFHCDISMCAYNLSWSVLWLFLSPLFFYNFNRFNYSIFTHAYTVPTSYLPCHPLLSYFPLLLGTPSPPKIGILLYSCHVFLGLDFFWSL